MANNIQIGADTSGFVSGIARAQASMAGLGSIMQRVLGTAGVMGTIGMMVRQFYSALEAGGALVDLSGQTGVAVDKLMELQLAFEQAGMSANDVQPVLAKLQRNIAEAATGSIEAATKFALMGISIEEIQGLSADEQLAKVGNAISKIENPTQRAAMAMEVFGKSGAKLLALFAAGGMEDVRKALGNQAALMLENAGIFDRASDVLGTAGTKIQGLFVGMASEVMPQIMGAVDALNGIDLSNIGQAFGNAIAFWINYFQNFGTTGDLIYNTLKLAFLNAVNFLGEELRVQLAVSAASIKNIFKSTSEQVKAMEIAANEARAQGPTVDTTETEARVQAASDAIEASKQATAAAAREKYGTPMPEDSGAGYIPKVISNAMEPMITSSAAKVGALGGAMWGGDMGLSIQREQLSVQQRIANSIDAFLKSASPANNPMLGDLTPAFGVI
jgi:hypothetical protein